MEQKLSAHTGLVPLTLSLSSLIHYRTCTGIRHSFELSFHLHELNIWSHHMNCYCFFRLTVIVTLRLLSES